jgi:hypothetical protein
MLASAAPAFANKPYFKTYGSDVMTGGWFENGGTCDVNTHYQTAGVGSSNLTGGILAFALEQGNSGKAKGGASSQYGVFSLGAVEEAHNPNSPYFGFYGDGANVGGSTRADDLTFANTPAVGGTWGGMFEGATKQSHCIPDYYGQKPSGATAISSGTTLNNILSTTGSGDYTVTPAGGTNYDLTSAPASVPADTRINIYVDGNVYIGNNIAYGAATADHVPKLRIVAKGNIYIDPGVSSIDGWYIAQPAGSGATVLTDDDGMIWTCHVDDQLPVLANFIATGCGSKLTVNGAMTAKKFNLVRLNGDVASANTGEDTIAGSGSGNISEVINFTPAMVIGGGFTGSSGGNTLPIDSLISLPPVF